jgi:hypothetical protein
MRVEVVPLLHLGQLVGWHTRELHVRHIRKTAAIQEQVAEVCPQLLFLLFDQLVQVGLLFRVHFKFKFKIWL